MQHPLTCAWAADDDCLPRLARAHEDDLDLAINMEMAAFRASYFAFPGLDARSRQPQPLAVRGCRSERPAEHPL